MSMVILNNEFMIAIDVNKTDDGFWIGTHWSHSYTYVFYVVNFEFSKNKNILCYNKNLGENYDDPDYFQYFDTITNQIITFYQEDSSDVFFEYNNKKYYNPQNALRDILINKFTNI